MTWARAAGWAGKLTEADAHATAGVAFAERTGDPAVLAPALTQAATVAFYRAEPWEELLERAIVLESQIERPLPLEAQPRLFRVLLNNRLADDVDRERTYMNELRAVALERGDEPAAASTLLGLSMIECRAGNFVSRRSMRAGAAEADRAEAAHLASGFEYCFALVDAQRGLAEEAARARWRPSARRKRASCSQSAGTAARCSASSSCRSAIRRRRSAGSSRSPRSSARWATSSRTRTASFPTRSRRCCS